MEETNIRYPLGIFISHHSMAIGGSPLIEEESRLLIVEGITTAKGIEYYQALEASCASEEDEPNLQPIYNFMFS